MAEIFIAVTASAATLALSQIVAWFIGRRKFKVKDQRHSLVVKAIRRIHESQN